MRSRRLLVLMALLFVQTRVTSVVNGADGKGPTDSGVPGSVRRSNVGPGSRRHEPLFDILNWTADETTSELQRLHPDQIEQDIQSIIERLSTLGLTSESEQASELLRRVRQNHRNLLASYEKEVSSEKKLRISLDVKWFEIKDPAAIPDSIKKLLGIEGTDVPHVELQRKPLLATVPTAEALPFLEKLVEIGAADAVVDRHLMLVNDQDQELRSGRRFNVSETEKTGTIVWIDPNECEWTSAAGTAREEQLNECLIGTTIHAKAAVKDSRYIKLHIDTKYSRIESVNSQNGLPPVLSRVLNAHVDVRDGHSIVNFMAMSTRNVATITKAPILGDLPGIGPRFFSKKYVRTERTYVIGVMTPQILDPNADEPSNIQMLSGEFSRPANQQSQTANPANAVLRRP